MLPASLAGRQSVTFEQYFKCNAVDFGYRQPPKADSLRGRCHFYTLPRYGQHVQNIINCHHD